MGTDAGSLQSTIANGLVLYIRKISVDLFQLHLLICIANKCEGTRFLHWTSSTCMSLVFTTPSRVPYIMHFTSI